MQKKRIAFINARPRLNSGRLKFMPFALSMVKLLDQAGHQVDLFLAEDRNDSYTQEFSSRVKVFFLDHKAIWARPGGRLHHMLLSTYFRAATAFKKPYDLTIGCGQVGHPLGQSLARINSCPLIYMSDEFPDIHGLSVWSEAESRAAQAADIIVVPDETRFERLCRKVPRLEDKRWETLPNAPLLEEYANLPQVEWVEKLGLPQGSKLFLQAGGMNEFNQIAESMFTVADWPQGAVLLVNGATNPYAPWSSFEHLDCPGRIFHNEQLLDNPEFHSLVGFSTASFGLYRNQWDLDCVGKSSGKIIRSLGCGRPVIASDLSSLKFIEEANLGVLVTHPNEIPAAVKKILEDEVGYSERCKSFYRQHLSFESYWPKFLRACEQKQIEL